MTELVQNNYRIIEDIKISEGENIETLYKAKPPFMQLENTMAPLGVLLWNRVTDTVKCHACGKWFKSINNFHLAVHKMDQELYREKFGFCKSIALCSRGVSEKIRKNNFLNGGYESFIRNRLPPKHYPHPSKEGQSRTSFLNSRATCPAQIQKRYEIVKNLARREPSENDFMKFDRGLSNSIKIRYGTLKNFREKFQIEFNRIQWNNGLSEEFLISNLRKFYEEKGSTSCKKYHRWVSRKYKGCMNTIIKRFGSWRRALAMAGLT